MTMIHIHSWEVVLSRRAFNFLAKIRKQFGDHHYKCHWPVVCGINSFFFCSSLKKLMVNRESKRKNASSIIECVRNHETPRHTLPSSWKYARIKKIRMEFLWIDSTNANRLFVRVSCDFSVFFFEKNVSLMLDKAWAIYKRKREKKNGFDVGFFLVAAVINSLNVFLLLNRQFEELFICSSFLAPVVCLFISVIRRLFRCDSRVQAKQ